jgi:hypothetical protein
VSARTQFLRAHPVFAGLPPAKQVLWLKSHPNWAAEWASITKPAAKTPVKAPAAPPKPGSATAAAAAAAVTPVITDPITALPYDATADDMEASAWSEYNNINSQANAQEADLNTNWTKQSRDLNESKDPIYRRLLNSYGGRGMARSSGYATALGQQDLQFANAKNDLDTSLASGTAGLVATRSNAATALKAILANASKRKAQTGAGKFLV